MSASPEKLYERLTYCIDFGETMLTSDGEFHPFGATLGLDGNVTAAGGYNGEENPAAQDIYRLLGEAFTSSATEGSIAAAALAANVDIPLEYEPPAPDGIRVLLESRGFSRFVYIPYVNKRHGLFTESNSITLFEPIAVEVGPSIFKAAANA
ncbi:hypothetical protein MUG10_08565 [Xanthomonas prunicola]|uniref:Uncharacterized protein n=1 Tax=Xanthomonas prunicola TaxID=2053930 RepID=A0A9Q9J6B4_9XANT|nr:hypothetical protein [Xanthomonas prunicola]USJ02142.1 hypothetical protein MUG10_08565 [Xanthomonas prunicola]UXA50648.1 hypothetical protein M0D44_09305 [Xanthomonas prunicola]UXA58956.1 hypothetical protein M0D47_09340 [Xanthomonas prunicola]UXA61098.1 hypothetical protein M0D48_19635 [Xanthomonas prunicola]UXA67165.1 hypothetical protein M0D43_09565 [Xanthomonas prunicola]